LGTPRLITDAANASRWEWPGSDPFGNNAPNENPAGLGIFAYNLRFPGQYFDAETGKHYNYFRDYDPAIGRYIQSDPIGLDGGTNTFGYVGGNPLLFSDSSGEIAFLVPALPALGDALICAAAAAASWGIYNTWKIISQGSRDTSVSVRSRPSSPSAAE
ncbi:MAG TPA: RHS repeat-associated core domain-containing protein, partial [Usitatibacter sp.]|nr:RHS repeat-associated core domain-containing protein [Usitatibacter sp.]